MVNILSGNQSSSIHYSNSLIVSVNAAFGSYPNFLEAEGTDSASSSAKLMAHGGLRIR